MIDPEELHQFNTKSFHSLNSEQNISDRYNEYSMNPTDMPYDDIYYEDMYCMNVNMNNMSYLNISCETNLSYSVPLYGYFAPFLLFTTVTANTLIVLVLSKRNMATPTNLVLMAMALCDMFTILFPAPGLWYMYTFGNHYKPLAPISACYAWNVFNEVVPATFHTASIWLTLALAVQRYIYVCHAPVARTWCTMPRVRKCIFYICLAAVLHQSTKFFDRSYTPVEIDFNNETTTVCHISIADWVDEYIGDDLYFSSYYLFRIVFVHLVPCVSLVTLNILLFKAMKQAQDRRKILFRENRKKECKKLRDANCTTLMLIVVVTVFLIVEIPLAVISALHIISSAIIEFLDYRVANLFILFANFFLMVSYPINFAIYCGMSRQFRETFKEIFIRRAVSGKKDNSSRYSLVNGPRTCTNETVL
ncbi:hypothetical protein HA402_010855 [Bradysia odoriphaga]|nr:hypothetical protein HA402_010855 [Bradysia odoriphaga]